MQKAYHTAHKLRHNASNISATIWPTSHIVPEIFWELSENKTAWLLYMQAMPSWMGYWGLAGMIEGADTFPRLAGTTALAASASANKSEYAFSSSPLWIVMS